MCIDEDTFEIALALEHSVQRIFADNATVKIFGKCVDSSEGCMLEAFARVLQSKRLTSDHCY